MSVQVVMHTEQLLCGNQACMSWTRLRERPGELIRSLQDVRFVAQTVRTRIKLASHACVATLRLPRMVCC